jgi:hypothetical protein
MGMRYLVVGWMVVWFEEHPPTPWDLLMMDEEAEVEGDFQRADTDRNSPPPLSAMDPLWWLCRLWPPVERRL